jgi:hypothetical protein
VSTQSSGLTRIRPQQVPDGLLQGDPNQNSESIRALAIKKEVDSLEHDRNILKEDIFNLSSEKQHDTKQLMSELSVLRKQKIKLIEEVKAISEMLFVLRGAEDKGKVSFDEFFTGREGVLVNFASAVNKRIDNKSKNLDTRSLSVINEENLSIEMTTYATSLLEGAYNALHEVAEAKNMLDFQARTILRASEDINTVKQKVQDNFMESDDKVVKARKMFANSVNAMKIADDYVREVTEKVDKLMAEAKVLGTSLQAKEKNLTAKEIRLKKLDIELGTRRRLIEKSEKRKVV